MGTVAHASKKINIMGGHLHEGNVYGCLSCLRASVPLQILDPKLPVTKRIDPYHRFVCAFFPC